MRIIDMLREATGEDYGEDAEAWMKAFDKPTDAQRGSAAEHNGLPVVPAEKVR